MEERIWNLFLSIQVEHEWLKGYKANVLTQDLFLHDWKKRYTLLNLQNIILKFTRKWSKMRWLHRIYCCKNCSWSACRIICWVPRLFCGTWMCWYCPLIPWWRWISWMELSWRSSALNWMCCCTCICCSPDWSSTTILKLLISGPISLQKVSSSAVAI